MSASALRRLHAAVADPLDAVAPLREVGTRIVWVLGDDLPYELVEAFGYHPVRLVPDARIDHRALDAMVGAETLSDRGRALLAAITVLPAGDALLISHADAEQPQIFATLRELARTGAIDRPQAHFLDLLTIDRASSRRYNRIRVAQAAAWLATLGGDATPDAMRAASVAGNARRALLAQVMALRESGRLSGVDAHAVVAASAILPGDTFADDLHAILAGAAGLPVHEGRRVRLGGSTLESLTPVSEIEAAGALIVAEDHGWGGDRVHRRLAEAGDPLDAFAFATLTPSWGPFSSAADRADRTARAVAGGGIERVVHLTAGTDEAAPWEVAALSARLTVPLLACRMPIDRAAFRRFLADGTVVAAAAEPVDAPPRRPPSTAPRSRKSLDAVARFGSYQREWFAGVSASARAGKTFAVVNANAPQEILRALDIPFVVNQWWASIVAAKQQSPRYAALLTAHHLPAAVEAYSAQGVAAAFDEDPAQAPWGGLPHPDILGAVLTTDATPRLFEAWATATGAKLQRYERSIESRWDIPIEWWDGLADRWDTLLEPERLDLFEAELRAAVAELEGITGTTFDAARFAGIMDLVNEQQGYYRATRDLIARTVPAPVSIVDTMPATMVPQWHRGTEWARDAAREFHDEVAARVAGGEAACPNERIRLMFVGRGLWSDMGFYQQWEESHGAVFVCSMYLSLAADGYIRRHDRGRDPLRALAARFTTMGDELRMPTWAGEWHVKEAKLHGCDGAVALSDADPLVVRALRRAGVAVLELDMDNFTRDDAAEGNVAARVAAFLDGPAAAASAARRG